MMGLLLITILNVIRNSHSFELIHQPRLHGRQRGKIMNETATLYILFGVSNRYDIRYHFTVLPALAYRTNSSGQDLGRCYHQRTKERH